MLVKTVAIPLQLKHGQSLQLTIKFYLELVLCLTLQQFYCEVNRSSYQYHKND